MAFTFTRTNPAPTAHAHVARNPETKCLEVFISDGAVEQSISGHLGPGREGVLGEGKYESLQHHIYPGLHPTLLADIASAAFDGMGFPNEPVEGELHSEYPGASGTYHHITLPPNVTPEAAKLLLDFVKKKQ